MLNEPKREANLTLSIARRKIPVIVGGNGFDAMTIEFPPVEELLEFREIAARQVSFHGVRRTANEGLKPLFLEEAKRAQRKEARFAKSPTYFSKLSDLFALGGDYEAAQRYNQGAFALDRSGIYALKVATDLVNAGDLLLAERVIAEAVDLPPDEAMTRRAVIAALEGNLDGAAKFVEKALQGDSTSSKARYVLGVLALAKAKFEVAVRNFRAASEELQNSSSLLVNLSIAYVCLGQQDKAIRTLRRATSVNPLDKNAVSVLADLTHQLGEHDLSISPLAEYLRYDQKSAGVWARMARAQYCLGDLDAADRALKQQCVLSNSHVAWNNRGVIAGKRNDDYKALGYYAHALRLAESLDVREIAVPAANYASVLLKHKEYEEGLKVTSSIVARDRELQLARNELTSEIYLQHFLALNRIGRTEQMVREIEAVLSIPDISRKLMLAGLTDLIFHYTLRSFDAKKALELCVRAIELPAVALHKLDSAVAGLLNNVAYTFIECGMMVPGRETLNRISQYIHHHPYITATAGLYHLRRGDLEKGQMLYREAMRLTPDTGLRKILAQKLDLEVGSLALSKGDERSGFRLLTRAIEVKGGADVVRDAARKALLGLPKPQKGPQK